MALEPTTKTSHLFPDSKDKDNKNTNFVPPNFVIVLADDLDWTLGGSDASTLQKTRRLIGSGQGKTFRNWFVQTPVCCASRSELLTGRMFHNLRTQHPDDQGCMHVDVNERSDHRFWTDYYFSNYMGILDENENSYVTESNNNTTHPLPQRESSSSLNKYKIGIFGKHLNNYNPTEFVPNGVDEMLINGGGDYLDPSFLHGKHNTHPRIQKFDDCFESTGMPCYSTAVIGNASVTWIREKVMQDENPFLALVSVKAPHIQDANGFPMAIPAPWYNTTTIPETLAPRTPNYNVTTNHHHWIVRNQSPLTQLQAQMVDALYVSRLKTLLSVDDLVEDLVNELESLNVLNNTYVVFTSDNGYRLGQFKMPCCKLHPYENDVRVPMMIRGPGIGKHQRSSSTPNIERTKKRKKRQPPPDALFSHVHLIPTLMGLATGKHHDQTIVPDTMDGTNLAGWLLDDNDEDDGFGYDNDDSGEEEEDAIPSSAAQNTENHGKASHKNYKSLLIEYTSLGKVNRYQHLIDTYNHTFVALRIMPKENDRLPQQGPTPRASSNEDIIITNIDNLKYVEFRDSRMDWTNTQTNPLERELYDLDKDPYELDNLLATPGRIANSLIAALERKMKRLVQCVGDECRTEHDSGLEFDAMPESRVE